MKCIAVIGGSRCTDEQARQARQVGRLLADAGAAVVCGGGAGIMLAACQGARERGGQTIGILPGADPAQANPFVQTPIATGLGQARNVIIILSASAVIAIGGEGGTLSEIGLALRHGKRVVSLGSWELNPPGGSAPPVSFMRAGTAEEAVSLALEV